MTIDFGKIKNPIFDCEPAYSPRDPAAIYHDGTFRCFHSAFERRNNRNFFYLNMCESRDLVSWGNVRRLTTSELNFSSPGNIIRIKDKWTMCVQSYPIQPGKIHGGEESRLWLMESSDLITWSEPYIIKEEGCEGKWTDSRRQIDPYLLHHDNKFWCFYKTNGSMGVLVSDDLDTWEEALQDRPVLSPEDTPDGATVENPCIIEKDDEFIMFFAPCREGRGIGVARSQNLMDWGDVRYLDFPELSWASGGPTAPMVLDMREELGKWLMFFHGDRDQIFGSAIGIAWSDDLENWIVP
jgi:hypothetical protein